ncbi:MAG: hypothetical protein ISS26_08215 [Candidatus Omnitrophica bacterium]|nr:hypothetical protein [Candidatus Omnitrophota bacterium]
MGLFEEVKDVISDKLGVKLEEVKAESNEEAEKIQTVGDVVKYIEKKTKKAIRLC